jgi:c-di-GMP-binding flagellar brake protein YcgR
MTAPHVERRRFPRGVVIRPCEVRVARRYRVRLADVSDGGALLALEERLPAGARGRLRVAIGGTLVDAAIEVERETAAADGRGRLAGVSLEGLQPVQRAALAEFLARAGR